MTTKRLPTTGSAALTYDRSADIGVFDGRVVAPKRTRTPAATPTARPQREQSQPRNPKAPAKPNEPAPRKGFLMPLLAGLALVVVGGGTLIYSILTVVASDQAAARAQDDLRIQFEQRQSLAAEGLLAGAFDPNAVVVTETEAVSGDDFDTEEDVPVIFGTPDDGPPVVNDPASLPGWLFEAPPPNGEALGRIVIPTASIDWVVVQGVNPNHLRKGPGHMPGTVMPGQYGNAVLSGHRTTYGGPFGNLDRMAPGDQFTVETLIGTHTYQVVSIEIVDPTDTWVVQPMDGGWLTLITCTPKYSSRQRLIVFSKLIDGPNADEVAGVYGTEYSPPSKPLPYESTPTPAG